MNYTLVFIGGGLGCLARHAVSQLSAKYFPGPFPMGTFISNFLSCTILAIVLYSFRGKIGSVAWLPFTITAFCGGFSTFSTWSRETLDLIQQGNISWAAANILVSIAACTGMIFFIRNA